MYELHIGGVDYSTANVQVTFAPDQTRRCVDIPIVDDNIPEEDEMFNVVIQNSDDVSPSQPSTTKITIIDEDRGKIIILLPCMLKIHINFSNQVLSLLMALMLK